MGEALEPSLQDAFPAVLQRFPQTRLELWVRTLKDALADVNDWGRLAYIVAEERLPSLAVMLAWRPGLIPALLPELAPAFQDLLATGDWAVMDAARRAGPDPPAGDGRRPQHPAGGPGSRLARLAPGRTPPPLPGAVGAVKLLIYVGCALRTLAHGNGRHGGPSHLSGLRPSRSKMAAYR